MPSVITHGIIGYILFGFKGLILSIIPDIIGFGYYFYRMFFIEKTINFNKSVYTWAPIDKMSKLDWFLYNISHSLILWFLLYYIFKEKFIFSAILAIILDILLHNRNRWLGPAFLYPLSEYRFNGIHWDSPKGYLITFTIIFLIYYNKKVLLKTIDKF